MTKIRNADKRGIMVKILTRYIFALWLMNPTMGISLLAGSELSINAAQRSTSYRRRPYTIVLMGSRVRLCRIRSPERIWTRKFDERLALKNEVSAYVGELSSSSAG